MTSEQQKEITRLAGSDPYSIDGQWRGFADTVKIVVHVQHDGGETPVAYAVRNDGESRELVGSEFHGTELPCADWSAPVPTIGE